MFSLELLNDIVEFDEAISYAEKNLKLISEGSHRVVFEFNDEKVIKITKDETGTIQNYSEWIVSRDGLEFFAKTYKKHSSSYWILSERCEQIKNISEFEEFSGTKYEKFCRHMRGHLMEDVGDMDEFTKKTIEICRLKNLNSSEFIEVDNWGLRNSDGKKDIVMVDYGDLKNNFNKRPRKYLSTPTRYVFSQLYF